MNKEQTDEQVSDDIEVALNAAAAVAYVNGPVGNNAATRINPSVTIVDESEETTGYDPSSTCY